MLFRSYRSFLSTEKLELSRLHQRVAVVSETIIVSDFLISLVKNRESSARLHALMFLLNSALFGGLRMRILMAFISVYVQAKIMYWFKFAPVETIIHIQSILFNILGHINFSGSYTCCTEYNSFVSCLLLKDIDKSNVILKSWKVYQFCV